MVGNRPSAPVAQPPGHPPRVADLARAVAHLAAGDFHAALYAASDACHADPDDAEAHYAYGQAWLGLNQAEKAEHAFATAIQRAPAWAEPWVNYGVARYRQGAIHDAKTAMREALRHAPGHVAASANLAAFLGLTGERDAADLLLRESLEREPRNAAARLNLVADLLQRGRAQQALALLEESTVQGNPAEARHWHLLSTLTLLQLGRPGEARAALEAFEAIGTCPPALTPLWLWRRLCLALAEHDLAAALDEAAAMEAALSSSGEAMLPEHRIMAHYDLAKFWAGQDEPARAFSHWRAGHDLLKPGQPFCRADHAAFVEASQARLDRRRLTDGPRATNRDPTPVFIVGMPRSGTTLCEQILAAHANVHGAGERGALAEAFHALGGSETADGVNAIAGLDGAALDAAAHRYLSQLRALAPDKARIVDKMPGNYRFLGLVGLMLPGARIIHCVRDPRDIGLSIFSYRFHGHHSYAHDIADLGWAIAQQQQLMAHWSAALPNPVLQVRLNDWVDDFDATLSRVLDHLGLAHDPACVHFHERDSDVRTVSYAQVRQPVNARGLGRWKTYQAELAPLIAELDAAGALEGWPDDPFAAPPAVALPTQSAPHSISPGR